MPLIGVTPQHNRKENHLWLRTEYHDLIKAFHMDFIVLPFEFHEKSVRNILKRLDGLLLSGGPDISPRYYNEDTLEKCHASSYLRDRSELIIAKIAYEEDLPTLGICRGLQVMNVALGGTLYQDIPLQCPDSIYHEMDFEHHDMGHRVFPEKDTYFSELYKKEFFVTSLHHQSVKDVPAHFRVGLRAADGIIEACYADDRTFYVGVQFHPELMFETNENSNRLIKEFYNACKKRS